MAGKPGIFTMIKWGFAIRDEINLAYKDDEKISAKEILTMYKNLSEIIEFPVDSKIQKTLDLVSAVVDETEGVVEDNKITIQEVIDFAEKICEHLGIELDKKGFDIPELGKKEE